MNAMYHSLATMHNLQLQQNLEHAGFHTSTEFYW